LPASAAAPPEWSALLELCSSRASLDARSSLAGLSPQGLIAIAEAHGVTGLLAKKLLPVENKPSRGSLQEILCGLRRGRLLASMALIAEMFRVLEILRGAEVAAAVVKGPPLSVRAFANPSFRQYVDVDFLIRSSEIERASGALLAAGFRGEISADAVGKRKSPGQYTFRRSKDRPLIELHTERTLRYFPKPVPIEEFLRRRTTVTIDSRVVPVLSVEDEFVLLAVHGAKHFWERLMWIADIAALVANYPQMDWTRVQKTAEGVGADRMVRVALLLAERTLQAPIPAEMSTEIESDRACLRIVNKIESWLLYAGQQPPALLARALFRFQMRGRLLAGAGYLTRLTLSPTEEDWIEGSNERAASLRESLRRPFRLARKYRRDQKETGQG